MIAAPTVIFKRWHSATYVEFENDEDDASMAHWVRALAVIAEIFVALGLRTLSVKDIKVRGIVLKESGPKQMEICREFHALNAAWASLT